MKTMNRLIKRIFAEIGKWVIFNGNNTLLIIVFNVEAVISSSSLGHEMTKMFHQPSAVMEIVQNNYLPISPMYLITLLDTRQSALIKEPDGCEMLNNKNKILYNNIIDTR